MTSSEVVSAPTPTAKDAWDSPRVADYHCIPKPHLLPLEAQPFLAQTPAKLPIPHHLPPGWTSLPVDQGHLASWCQAGSGGGSLGAPEGLPHTLFWLCIREPTPLAPVWALRAWPECLAIAVGLDVPVLRGSGRLQGQQPRGSQPGVLVDRDLLIQVTSQEASEVVMFGRRAWSW